MKGAEQALQKVELSERILAQNSKPPPRRLYISLAFALLCFALVSFAWSWHLPNPLVHLDVDVETVVLKLAKTKDFHWQGEPGLETDAIQVEGVVEIEAPGLGLTGITERLDVGGKGVMLKWLKASAGARLEVERGSGYIDLYVYDGVLQGQIELQEAELGIFHKGRPHFRTISGSVPETLIFTTPREGGTRVRLRLQTSKDWRIDNLHINGMAFERELPPPDKGNRVSTILKGTIELPEVKRKVTLLENDWLRLGNANSTRLHLSFAAADQNCFNLFFQGRARSLSAGPEGFEQNLAPSLLTYLYHQKQLTFFWSTLVFIYGLLWSLRNVIKS
jgi:hypothetical protein